MEPDQPFTECHLNIGHLCAESPLARCLSTWVTWVKLPFVSLTEFNRSKHLFSFVHWKWPLAAVDFLYVSDAVRSLTTAARGGPAGHDWPTATCTAERIVCRPAGLLSGAGLRPMSGSAQLFFWRNAARQLRLRVTLCSQEEAARLRSPRWWLYVNTGKLRYANFFSGCNLGTIDLRRTGVRSPIISCDRQCWAANDGLYTINWRRTGTRLRFSLCTSP